DDAQLRDHGRAIDRVAGRTRERGTVIINDDERRRRAKARPRLLRGRKVGQRALPHEPCQLIQVLIAEQLGRALRREPRVTVGALPLAERDLERLYDLVRVLDGAVTDVADAATLQHTKRLDDDETLRPRRGDVHI